MLTRSDLRDTLTGGLGDDAISGNGGNDLLRGDKIQNSRFGGGDDTISGGEGNDGIAGENGNDRLFGDAGNDWIWGGLGDDFMDGGKGDDLIGGGIGDDFIDGGEGDDELWGDFRGAPASLTGSDTFVLAAGNGTDRIFDFEVGIDRLHLAAGLTADQLSVTTVGDGTKIALNDEVLAILQNVEIDNPAMLEF